MAPRRKKQNLKNNTREMKHFFPLAHKRQRAYFRLSLFDLLRSKIWVPGKDDGLINTWKRNADDQHPDRPPPNGRNLDQPNNQKYWLNLIVAIQQTIGAENTGYSTLARARMDLEQLREWLFVMGQSEMAERFRENDG